MLLHCAMPESLGYRNVARGVCPPVVCAVIHLARSAGWAAGAWGVSASEQRRGTLKQAQELVPKAGKIWVTWDGVHKKVSWPPIGVRL